MIFGVAIAVTIFLLTYFGAEYLASQTITIIPNILVIHPFSGMSWLIQVVGICLAFSVLLVTLFRSGMKFGGKSLGGIKDE